MFDIQILYDVQDHLMFITSEPNTVSLRGFQFCEMFIWLKNNAL